MIKKYKELPAFETNDFKFGDRVRVYTNDGFNDGFVTNDVSENTLIVDFDDDSADEYHFKQCRKLEEVKPREFMIAPKDQEVKNSDYDEFIEELDLSDNKMKINAYKETGWIRVREVLGEED